MSKRKHRYVKARIKAADVLCAFDVLYAMDMHDEALKLLSISVLNRKGLLEMLDDGASEADERNIRGLAP